MGNIWRRTAIGLAIAGTLFALRFVPREQPAATIRQSRPLMGTVWTIEIFDEGRPAAAQSAINAAFAELVRIDQLMSEWKPDSPISRVNTAAGIHPVEVPAELREMLERARHYSEISDGAFDITWRGMGRIWKFDDSFRPPTPAAVDAARRNVDYRAVQIDGNRIFLPKSTMSIGLGGIAKGYAVDRAAEVIARAGFANSLVDGGGDVRVSGARAGAPWRLGIQHPRKPRGELLGAVSPVNQALLTSGDYERFREVDGVRYHHIIDVRTGWPARAATSVTVLSDSAEKGVVLAKVIFILGPEKGLALARAEKVEALLIDPAGRAHATPGFPPLQSQEGM
jgi:thiamine biosynthesis lipoprotein